MPNDRLIPEPETPVGRFRRLKQPPMAVVIRLKRTGRRNRPCYRISVADSRFPRDGRVLENLGLYDPICPDKEKQATLNVESARNWLTRGALPSETCRSLFKRFGVYEGEFAHKETKRDRSGRKKKTATRARKQAKKDARATAKSSRLTGRKEVKSAAAKAAKSAEASSEE
ncbi:MAG: small subunit ribosomal protein S16 [Planctomycetota bacterium]|jgi:small subunit ribosomal protein S16